MRFEKSTDNKYELIHNSIAVINFFKTLGIESIFLKKFTLFLNIKSNKSNYIQYLNSHFFKVKYLDHYKILNDKFFYINSIDKLSKKLDLIIKNEVNLKIPTILTLFFYITSFFLRVHSSLFQVWVLFSKFYYSFSILSHRISNIFF